MLKYIVDLKLIKVLRGKIRKTWYLAQNQMNSMQNCLLLLKKGESIAKEVLKYREEVNTGHFASSTQVRNFQKFPFV